LGVLYVVDSVTRQWVDQARKAGQSPGSGAPDGTFAAGVNRVTELLHVLLTDIINTAPDDQKVRYRYADAKSLKGIPSTCVYVHFIEFRLHAIRSCFQAVASTYDLEDSTYVS
jgi:hypothetical protein